jgi:phosphatidate cytidylyltransferase
MKKILARLLIFCIGVPLLAGIVLLLPYYHYLAINLLLVLVSALGAVEFSVLLAQKQLSISKTMAAILGALPPVLMILIINFNLSDILIPGLVAVVLTWLLISGILAKGEALDNFINRLVAGFAILLYPGMLIAWMVRLSQWGTHSGIIILTFLAIVFGTDGAAWAAGMLFGRGNQGLVPASPNKSIAGFIGGIIMSGVLGGLAAHFWPEIFQPVYNLLGGTPFAAGFILGIVTGAAAILGDLAESAIKRSSGLKDSGSLIPGRGGVLDSIDSVTLAAPVFYLAYCLLCVPLA